MNTHLTKAFVMAMGLALFASCQSTPTANQESATVSIISEDTYANLPFEMDKVRQPAFPAYEVSIVDFGAKPDGITLNTEAINKAIRQVHEKGGGKVIVPAGLWLTGPIELLSNVNLHLEYNALVLFSADHSLYPIISTSFEGLSTMRCQSPIFARNAENIAITGHGTIDGNGDTWRPVKKSKLTEGQWKKLLASGGVTNEKGDVWYPSQGALDGATVTKDFNVPDSEIVNADNHPGWESIRDFLRPVLLSFSECRTVLLEGVTFKNSPSWCLHPMMCEHLTVNNISVSNPWYSQNGDALDIESCTNVLVLNSTFDAGDDAICIKSGKNEEGRKRGIPTQNVIVRNNTVLHGHGGFVVGSEMSGGVKNIFVDNCTFLGTDVGLRFKSTRGRGGIVENIHINKVNMINIPGEPILFDLFYGGASAKDDVPPVSEETPVFRNIYIDDVTCKGSGRAIFFNGLPEMPIENINLNGITISDATEGAVLSHAKGVNIDRLTITTKTPSPTVSLRNISTIKINGQAIDEVGEEGKTLNFDNH